MVFSRNFMYFGHCRFDLKPSDRLWCASARCSGDEMVVPRNYLSSIYRTASSRKRAAGRLLWAWRWQGSQRWLVFVQNGCCWRLLDTSLSPYIFCLCFNALSRVYWECKQYTTRVDEPFIPLAKFKLLSTHRPVYAKTIVAKHSIPVGAPYIIKNQTLSRRCHWKVTKQQVSGTVAVLLCLITNMESGWYIMKILIHCPKLLMYVCTNKCMQEHI